MSKLYVSKILPLVYEQSLSYYEILIKVRCTINEIIKIINSNNVSLEEVTNKVTSLEKELASVPSLLDELQRKLDAEILERIESVNAEIEQRESEDERIWEAIRQLQIMIDLYSNASIVKLENIEGTVVDMQELDISEV